MKKYYELKDAIEYIEQHLTDKLCQKDIASAAAVSLSSLQKMFQYSLGYSVKEYILKRQMSDAAAKLITENASVTALAFEYKYRNVESFSRAFRRIYGVSPSCFKRAARHGEFFPQIGLSGDGIGRDSAALAAAIQENADRYVVCFDIVGLTAVNAVSRQAGDAALAAALHRIYRHTDAGWLVFRIGGDEFAVITDLAAAEDAERFMACVLAHNGEGFAFDGRTIPMHMRGWFGKNASVASAERPGAVLQKRVKYQGKPQSSHEGDMAHE